MPVAAASRIDLLAALGERHDQLLEELGELNARIEAALAACAAERESHSGEN